MLESLTAVGFGQGDDRLAPDLHESRDREGLIGDQLLDALGGCPRRTGRTSRGDRLHEINVNLRRTGGERVGVSLARLRERDPRSANRVRGYSAPYPTGGERLQRRVVRERLVDGGFDGAAQLTALSISYRNPPVFATTAGPR